MTNPAAFAWPDGKRIAIVVQVMFEAWSEGKSPAYSVQTTGLKPGFVDHSNVMWPQYGGRVGAWRLMRTLERFGAKGSFAVSGRCTELYPDAVARIVAGGHELVAHAVTQDQLLAYMTLDEQREVIRQSFAMLERAGQRPRGWISPVLAWTPETAGFLAQEGALWYGDVNYTDLPIMLKTAHGPLVGVPVSDFTDNRLLRSSPRHLFDVYRDTFDYLYRNEPMSMMSMLLHCHTGGRAPMVAAFEQILQHVSRHPDVWFTTVGDMAQWVKDSGFDEISYAGRYFS